MMPPPTNDWQARALAAAADVARLREALEAIRTAFPFLYAAPDIDEMVQEALAATSTPPDAVAALVRAAREVVAVGKGERSLKLDDGLVLSTRVAQWISDHAQIELLRQAMDDLATLLDTPPWGRIG